MGRRSDPKRRRFVQIARGSANALEYPLMLAKDLRFLSVDEFKDREAKTLEIQRMLAALMRRLGLPILAGSQQLEASSSCE
ncbi:MAG TPA: four helix bundle protein [Candidatus Sulfotelmatobacter sp.]